MQRNILTVFIASPSDLNKEREIAREVCSRVNNVLGRTINWEVELLGWEDTIPGANRPQVIINEDIRECDLFLGLLWKRWGQPTGEFDSGFFEEFTLAKNLREEKSLPEIWLFFKSLAESEKSDPGPQLSKVLEFKRKIENEKQILYKAFFDTNDFNTKLYDFLLKYILKLSDANSNIEINESEKSKSEIKNKRIENDHVYSIDVANILDYKEDKDNLLTGLNLNRINLFTSLLITNLYGSITIDNHMINRVYANRNKFELSEVESVGLITVLLNDNKYYPGWYWLEKFSAKKIYSIIRKLTSSDQLQIRKIAIKAIVKYNISINIKDDFERLLNDDSVIDLLPLIRNTKYLPTVIEKFRETKNNSLKKEIQKLEFEILLRSSEKDAIDFFISNISFNHELLYQVSDSLIKKIDNNVLLTIYKDVLDNYKVFLIRLLFKLNKLNEEEFNIIFETKNLSIQELILIEALKQNYTNFLSDKLDECLKNDQISIDIIIKIHKKLKIDYELKSSEPNILTDHKQYEISSILNIKDKIGSIRKNLSDNFHDFILKDEENYRRVYKIESEDLFEDELIQFIVARYIRSSLSVIYRRLEKSDLLYARKYYSNTIYNLADEMCLSIFKKIGEEADLALLKSCISDNRSATQNKLCVEAILRINPSLENLIFLISTGNKSIIRDVQTRFNQYPEKLSVELIVSKLASNNINIRNSILNYIITNEYDLNEILNLYLEEAHYYHVVVSLDIILYSPKKIRDQIINDIKYK